MPEKTSPFRVRMSAKGSLSAVAVAEIRHELYLYYRNKRLRPSGRRVSFAKDEALVASREEVGGRKPEDSGLIRNDTLIFPETAE